MKTIPVNPDQKTTELIHEFQESYPHLRLEIYHNGQEMSHVDILLKDIAAQIKPVAFTISPQQKVVEIETVFWENMGIQVEIFRMENGKWIAAEDTYDWSLLKENKGKS